MMIIMMTTMTTEGQGADIASEVQINHKIM